jgi:hypothetical protein
MELGNIVFGNSRGPVPIERGEGYERELERLFCAIDPDYFRDTPHENEVFAIRSYYWGDCTCGFEQKDWQWSEDNKHKPECYQTDYKNIPEKIRNGFLSKAQRAAHDKAIKAVCEKHGIPWDGGRGCAVHCNCCYQTDYEKWRGENDHDKKCPIVLPNFEHKTSGFWIKWYKYPLRDSYASREIEIVELRKIVDDCIRSLRSERSVNKTELDVLGEPGHVHSESCGFDRNGSHNAGHYVCSCGWEDVATDVSQR